MIKLIFITFAMVLGFVIGVYCVDSGYLDDVLYSMDEKVLDLKESLCVGVTMELI